jgi:hypothetical protein
VDVAHNIAVDSTGAIYVAEIKNWRVQKSPSDAGTRQVVFVMRFRNIWIRLGARAEDTSSRTRASA